MVALMLYGSAVVGANHDTAPFFTCIHKDMYRGYVPHVLYVLLPYRLAGCIETPLEGPFCILFDSLVDQRFPHVLSIRRRRYPAFFLKFPPKA